MDTMLCDELLQEIFKRLPSTPSAALSVSLVSKRWLNLYRSSKTSLSLSWVVSFPCLKELCLYICPNGVNKFGSLLNEELDAEFGLETLFLSGIQAGDEGIGWLWRNCKRLKKLQLKNCASVGDGESFSSFILCVKGLQEVDLRKCRSIVDGVLLKLAENCGSLNSLLVYDGGSKEGLLEFINTCRCNLQKLDLRLPLDLNNTHLSAVAMNLRHLSTLKLQSCCLVTGEGLNTLGTALYSSLEELALINCDVVEREIGLLATLGQNLRILRKLDLSYNEFLVDKELTSMLISCNNLTDLKLRGCRKITGVTLFSMSKNIKCLQSVDIMNCPGIEAEAVEFLVLNCSQMRQMVVEENKVSNIARTWALHKVIEVTSG
ncbi:hypothetical protein GOBAR_AA00487 [Gossypium barbadense]|uniref:F-box domain-containing protein n=1 Tax=Gossypium barbadense TaxID=3634 RepID=A0A2P5YWY3_GOSBA|nr:hypothetical protein GOBAR_AA00487 [Gossypium barbadense]